MTLTEWLFQTPNASISRYGQSNCFVVYEQNITRTQYRKLWHLSDCVVTSVISGPAVILSPRGN